MRFLLGICSALVLIGFATGCRTTIVTPKSGDSYIMRRHLNHWDVRVDKPLDQVYKATLAGLDSMGIEPIYKKADSISARVDAELASGHDITVKMAKHTSGSTIMTVYVSPLSEESKATAIFESISKEL